MSYSEDDASELTDEIISVINDDISIGEDKELREWEVLNKVKRKILELIRKKLKLTRSYKTIAGITSSIHGDLQVEQEDYVEISTNYHHGFRLLFGEVQTEDDEKYNIKLLPAKEIRFLLDQFNSILLDCDHVEKKQWTKEDMGIGEDGERWYHYVCPCGILQDVEIIPEA